MKIWLMLFALLLAGVNSPARADATVLAATTLEFTNSVKAELAWEKGPSSPAESVVLVTFRNASGEVVAAPAPFKVILWMPGMGHGSAPTLVEKSRTAEGAYRVSRLYFTMPGAWELRLQLGAETRALALNLEDLAATEEPFRHVASESSLGGSPAFAAICADGVTPHPRLKGFWHLDYPHFALTDDTLYATMELRPNEQGSFAVVKVDRTRPDTFEEVVRFKERVRDLAFRDGKVWALFAGKVVALDAANGQEVLSVATAQKAMVSEEESAQAFAWVGGKLVIAHGTLGMAAFDEAAGAVTMAHSLDLNDGGRISKAVEVTALSDTQALFAVENVSVSNHPPYPFEGLVIMNLEGGRLLEKYAYDRKTSGSIAQARLQVVDGNVLINNWGILHQVSLAAMRAQGSVTVHWTPIRFDVDGRRLPGELLGDFVVDGDDVLACGHTQYQDEATRAILHKGVVYQKNLRELLERR